MKKFTAITLAAVIILITCIGCGNQLSGQGYYLIDDEGTYITYRLKCPSCGVVYDTNHQIPLLEGQTFAADIICDNCFENIPLSITRK